MPLIGLGIVLLIVGYFLGLGIINTVGYILVVVGVVLLLLSVFGVYGSWGGWPWGRP
jgi:hypothetical protein